MTIGFIIFLFILVINFFQKKNNTPKIYYFKNLVGGFNGCTIPLIGIFIKTSERSNELLLEHEMIHWKQYQKHGLIGFPVKYLIEQVKNGYDKNIFEIEARFRESDYCQLNYTECVRNGKAKTVFNPKFRM